MDNQEERLRELQSKNTRNINGTQWTIIVTAENL